MAAADPQRQLLSLIRDFATEKSQGERRVVCLKKRIQELRSELDLANAELEDVKRLKVTTEQDLKGYEVELAMSEASIQTLEARISLIQDEISTGGSDLEALKNEEGALRDDFIDKMFGLNTDIRKFQQTIARAFNEDNSIMNSIHDGQEESQAKDAEVSRRSLENKIDEVISQTNVVEQECQAEQNIHKQIQEELIELERKVFLMQAVINESKELQDLTRQTSELEQMCASLGEELQRRCACPSCHQDNVEALDGILRTSDAN